MLHTYLYMLSKGSLESSVQMYLQARGFRIDKKISNAISRHVFACIEAFGIAALTEQRDTLNQFLLAIDGCYPSGRNAKSCLVVFQANEFDAENKVHSQIFDIHNEKKTNGATSKSLENTGVHKLCEKHKFGIGGGYPGCTEACHDQCDFTSGEVTKMGLHDSVRTFYSTTVC